MSRPLLLGHRGARAVKSVPENSVASFDLCMADGCDGFEFDVRLTADGKPVIWHDPRFESSSIAISPARQLSRLATLENVLERYSANAFLDIELKVSGLERTTAELLKKHPPQRGFVVSSFLRKFLHALHDADSGVPLGLICETNAQLRGWAQLPIHYVIAHQRLVISGLVEDVHEAGKKLFVWTVNTAAEMRRFEALGVDGIISDDTSLLSQTLLKGITQEQSRSEPD